MTQLRISLWSIPIAISFLIGGLLQYFSLITPTKTNMVCLALFSLILVKTKNLKELKQEYILLLLTIYTAFLYIASSSSFSSFLVYAYYILCIAVSTAAGRAYYRYYSNKHPTFSTIRLITIFLSIQAVVTSMQNAFTDSFVKFSNVEIGSVDAIFGTLYLHSDASLGAISLLLLIAAHSLKASTNRMIMLAALTSITVFNGNSTAMQATLIIVIAILVAEKFPKKRLTIPATLLALSILTIIITSDTANHAFYALLETIHRDFDDRNAFTHAGRLAPLGHILFEPPSFIGAGLLTYYSPITKEWLYNSGFSTLYSLYIDAGLVFISLFCAYIFFLFKKTDQSRLIKFSIGLCILSYSLFNFILTDIALCFTIGFLAALLTPPMRRSQNQNL